MKLYIAILDEFPDFMVPTLVAHTMMRVHEAFKDDLVYQQWLAESFKKCTVRVNRKEFDRIAALDNVVVGCENKTLGGIDSCLVVCPRVEQPNVLKWAKLWAPKKESNEEQT